MVKVLIPQPLQGLTGGKSETEVSAGTIVHIIKELENQFPGFAERITEDGKIRRFVNIYVDEMDIRFLYGEGTIAKSGAEVSIIPALAGGEEEVAGGEDDLPAKKKKKKK
jgi:molybdopterin synthase sulfur carrier subunit